MQMHMLSLNSLCCICRNICVSKRQKKNYNHASKCFDFTADMLLICGPDISNEIDNMYSKFLRVKCFATIYVIQKSRSLTSIKMTKENFLKAMDIWCEFQPTSLDMCKLCSHRQSLTRRFFKPACVISSPSTTPEPRANTAESTLHTKPAQSRHNYQITDNDIREETVHTEMEKLYQLNFT